MLPTAPIGPFLPKSINGYEKLMSYDTVNTLSAMLAFNIDIATLRNRKNLQQFISERLKKLIGFDFISLAVLDPDNETFSPFMPSEGEVWPTGEPPHYPVSDSLFQQALNATKPLVCDLSGFQRTNIKGYIARFSSSTKTLVSVALHDHNKRTGALFVASRTANYFSSERLDIIRNISLFLSAAISNILAFENIEKQVQKVAHSRKQLETQSLYLREELKQTHDYSEIIGSSPQMSKVFELVSQVASTQSSVLILGETGTGKELIARAIHNTSPRRDKVMVKVNCASLPANLIESELFGHERGSFTGAIERRIGKFELANNSTLFLDEIGELPLDLQVKLLRALQEKEIERIGGTTTIKINVRIIAATNRNLLNEVQHGKFRSDLYFRLNVFPITLPALRDRKEDVLVLASHFLIKHSKNSGKTVMNFSAKVIKELRAYDWPGNVRELEHLIERSILLTPGAIIKSVSLPISKEEDKKLLPDSYVKTIDEIEREYIISILKKSDGKISGVGGAAEMLRIPSTTLNSKIKRLNIRKGYIES